MTLQNASAMPKRFTNRTQSIAVTSGGGQHITSIRRAPLPDRNQTHSVRYHPPTDPRPSSTSVVRMVRVKNSKAITSGSPTLLNYGDFIQPLISRPSKVRLLRVAVWGVDSDTAANTAEVMSVTDTTTDGDGIQVEDIGTSGAQRPAAGYWLTKLQSLKWITDTAAPTTQVCAVQMPAAVPTGSFIFYEGLMEIQYGA